MTEVELHGPGQVPAGLFGVSAPVVHNAFSVTSVPRTGTERAEVVEVYRRVLCAADA